MPDHLNQRLPAIQRGCKPLGPDDAKRVAGQRLGQPDRIDRATRPQGQHVQIDRFEMRLCPVRQAFLRIARSGPTVRRQCSSPQ